MNKSTIKSILFFASFILLPVPLAFSDSNVYGWNMMTEQERIQHRETLRKLKTEEEKQKYRIEHHHKMQERAKERGLNLPDMPQHERMNQPPMGDGFGGGAGGGKGMGKGR